MQCRPVVVVPTGGVPPACSESRGPAPVTAPAPLLTAHLCSYPQAIAWHESELRKLSQRRPSRTSSRGASSAQRWGCERVAGCGGLGKDGQGTGLSGRIGTGTGVRTADVVRTCMQVQASALLGLRTISQHLAPGAQVCVGCGLTSPAPCPHATGTRHRARRTTSGRTEAQGRAGGRGDRGGRRAQDSDPGSDEGSEQERSERASSHARAGASAQQQRGGSGGAASKAQRPSSRAGASAPADGGTERAKGTGARGDGDEDHSDADAGTAAAHLRADLAQMSQQQQQQQREGRQRRAQGAQRGRRAGGWPGSSSSDEGPAV